LTINVLKKKTELIRKLGNLNEMKPKFNILQEECYTNLGSVL